MSMVLISMAVAGVAAAAGSPDWILLLNALIGTAFVAFSSSVFNQVIERHFDAEMPRTYNRPIAAGRIGIVEASAFGFLLFVVGVSYLLVTTNSSATFWAAMTWLFYVCVYTPMKRMTAWNTAVGAIPGALPILIGWTALSREAIDERAVWLFAILFVWQFPHFMAIAWLYKRQYADAGFRMMSHQDVRGRNSGITAIAGAALLLVLILLQPAFGMGSVLATVPAALLAIGLLGYSFSFFQDANEYTARRLLRASLIFLPANLIIITLSQFGIL
jgi:protoheme IX farnesyltransferase